MYRVCALLLLVLLLVACTGGPGDNTARIMELDASAFDGAVVVDPAVMRGADAPHWASCRYEPPSALCTSTESAPAWYEVGEDAAQ